MLFTGLSVNHYRLQEFFHLSEKKRNDQSHLINNYMLREYNFQLFQYNYYVLHDSSNKNIKTCIRVSTVFVLKKHIFRFSLKLFIYGSREKLERRKNLFQNAQNFVAGKIKNLNSSKN